MNPGFYSPDIAGLIQKRQQEGATTSVDVGSYAKPLGSPLARMPWSEPEKKKKRSSEESEWLTWEDYLGYTR